MIDLSDRHVLVTGAGRGIGAATARLLARAGACVWIHYRVDERSADRILGEVRTLNDGPHRKSAAELGDPAAVEGLFEEIRGVWGRLDCLVNNAGIWVHNPLAKLDAARLGETLAVNVEGPFLCARYATELLADSDNGNIVNISSTAGQRGEADYSPYAASKGAIIAATKSWSTELAPRIRVNAVAPGWVDTDMCEAPFADGGLERIAAGIPLGRVATPDEIAGPVVFLASDLARFVTGEILNVNGGSVLAG